ncbi:MAG: M48 family metalloprotease [Euryarchaeota archaeon]|nr:M48 family metalloprotease [Euryarchaeota archaeon]MBU4492393.1 M48 family metalloprotease [Euryarchaeota archaeon]MCG2727184.1 M48 family metalloprotease [Candidatus Methanoperedenaceae archaeon]
MWLQIRLYLLLGLMFAIVYAMIAVVAGSMGVGTFMFYGVLASVMLLIQYLIGPKMVEWSMGIKYVSEAEYPSLHRMVAEMAQKANIPKPRVGIANVPIPNAFAFGRWKSDGRVCVTDPILRLLSPDELKAVIGHEIAHLKHRDVAVITTLSVIPMIMWYIAWSTMFSGGRDRGNAVVIGIFAFLMYMITNLLVLYASRIREYYADERSVKLGNAPHAMASALYKLVYGSARVDKNELKHVEGLKAFFVNDPSRALTEIRELSQIDKDRSGTIDQHELMMMSTKKISVSTSDKFMELMSTHPNMVKRIHRLSKIAR